jgi:pyrroloquinoline-quinone synthase
VGAQMRLLYTTALYHDYVEKEISLPELGLAA